MLLWLCHSLRFSAFDAFLANHYITVISRIYRTDMANGGTAAQLYIELNTGATMPAVGLGTWQAEAGVVGNSVKKAIEVGYRHIDCARIYKNEKEIGVALKEILSSGAVKREDLWITSKLWLSDCSPEKAPAAIDATLHDLQLDYVDLYLVHWPNKQIASTWEAMEKILETGKVRAIGVSNFSVKKLQELIEHAKVIPAVNQVECHPVWQQQKLHEYCKSQNIHLSAYSPIGSPGTGLSKKPVKVLELPIIKQVAEKLGKTPAQVALRWGLQTGHSILPKSSTESRIKENFDVFDWSIPPELFAQFSQIEQVKQLLGDSLVDSESDYFTSVEELWDGEL